MNKAQTRIFVDIFASFAKSFDYHPSSGKPFTLPVISITQLKMLLNNVKQQFSHEPIVLDLNGPITVVGDIHGHIFDLFRIINKYYFPGSEPGKINSSMVTDDRIPHFLFLGDIVDRGEFSLETLTLIFLMKAINPTKVHIIRGNHEFTYLCSQMGFMAEVNQMYPNSKMFSDYMSVLAMIPLCAIINKKFICLHGGIGPSFESIDQIKAVQRPLELYDIQIINELLWSDPSDEAKTFIASPRGSGFLFGKESLVKNLAKINMEVLVRGHNCVVEGVCESFDGKCITVFTASRYCDKQDNKAGVLIIKNNEGLEYEIETFPPLPYVRRKDTIFVPLQTAVHATQNHPPFKRQPALTLKSLNTNQPRNARSLRGSTGTLIDGF